MLLLIMDMIILNTILRVIPSRYPIHISVRVRVRDGLVCDLYRRSSEGGHTEVITLDLTKEICLVRLIG